MAISQSKPVVFVHVSSSGGTALCKWAQEQPCGRVPACGANCNLNCAHPWDWKTACRPPACAPPIQPCRAPFKPGCDGLARYARRRNLTFFASETLLKERCFSHFDYVTVLRDPIARLQSQILRSSMAPNTWLKALLDRRYAFNTSTSSSFMGTAALDNYVTRLLLGPSAFFLPLRGINSSHFQAASRILAAFTLAIPIDRLEQDGAVLLRARLGWHGAPERSNSHRRALMRRAAAGRQLGAAPHSSARHAAPSSISDRHLRVLTDLNQYDLRLLEEARVRFDAQLRQLQTQLQAGRVAAPTSPCAIRQQPQCPTGRSS